MGREKTQFKPGNPGKPKGATTKKVTPEFKATLDAFIEQSFPDVKASFDKLSDKEKVAAYLKFLEFRMPKYSSLQLDANKLTEEYLDRVLEREREKYDQEKAVD